MATLSVKKIPFLFVSNCPSKHFNFTRLATISHVTRLTNINILWEQNLRKREGSKRDVVVMSVENGNVAISCLSAAVNWRLWCDLWLQNVMKFLILVNRLSNVTMQPKQLCCKHWIVYHKSLPPRYPKENFHITLSPFISIVATKPHQ